MRRATMLWMASMAAAATCAACSTLPAPVPLETDPAGRQLLAGEWVGQYESPATGRSGSITFVLEQHADSTVCRGDVLMVPRGTNQPLLPTEGLPRAGDQQLPELRVLNIGLLKVQGDQLTGAIESYSDPETGHPISTTFEGKITGDLITGRLISVDEKTGQEAIGSWQVSRRKGKN